jgi:hypothetical protein
MMPVMAKRKTTPADAKRTPTLHMRLSDELEAALSRFIASQRIKPDRTAVGITALEELLSKEGYWPPPPPKPSK